MAESPAYVGRGRVHLTAPLLPSGAVSTVAVGSWGTNWPAAPANAALLSMPPGRPVGNARQLSISQQTLTPNTAAYPRPGQRPGGPIVQGATATLSLYGMGAENLADYLGGVRHESVGRDVVDVIATGGARLGSQSILFASEPVDLAAPISVTPSWTTWAIGVHWVPEQFGIRLLSGCSAPIGSTVEVAYRSASGFDLLENLQATREMGVVYEGVNAIDGRRIRADIYRAQLPPAQSHELVSDGVAVVDLTLILKPVLPAGAARPKWYRIMRSQHD